jgi:chromosome segregation protein
VHLTSLTLRGFKSFASATTLPFEPGITCVVGPNGAGKSNIVDALAWVMGEQGAKSLRGGTMEDVIFAGTAGRPPLGRAEVVLTIDNADRRLPIDYSEVVISRILFRSGGSEYAINGQRCRLLDVSELLSDTGIGRELHVVVGQGQLDAVLHATPDERRAFVEEAAGVLKHRRRKEKALRKIDAMSANLTRLTDLVAELRRQLKPLGRQAELARRAAVVQAELRDARLRLLADDLVTLRDTLHRDLADDTATRQRRVEVERTLDAARTRENDLDAAVATAAPRLERAQETWYRLAGLRERLRGTADLAAERQRHLIHATPAGREGPDPAGLTTEAAALAAPERQLGAAVERDRAALAAAVEARATAEAAAAAADQEHAAALRAAAQRREGLARLQGTVAGLRTRAAAADAEIERLSAALGEAEGRAAAAQEEFTALETQVASLDDSEVGLDEEYEAAAAAVAVATTRVAALQEEERDAERERCALLARTEALALGLAGKDGADALLGAGSRVPGLLGPVAALLRVPPEAQAAVAAALGAAVDAVAVESLQAALAALRLLKDDDAGRVGLLVARPPDGAPTDRPAPPLPAGARYAVDLVQAPEALRAALASLLDRVVVVDGLDVAHDLVARDASLRAATRHGDLLGAGWAVGGSPGVPSRLDVQAAADETGQRLAAATGQVERLAFALAEAREQRRQADERAQAALARLHESDARLAAVAERLGHLGSVARAAAAEADRLRAAGTAAQAARGRDRAGLGELERRLSAAQAAERDGPLGGRGDEPDPGQRESRAAAARAARAAETEARLAVRTGEERMRALAGRVEELERAAAAERAARDRLAALRVRREREARVAAAVAQGATAALTRLERSLLAAGEERAAAEQGRVARERELTAVRAQVRDLAAELDRLTDAAHRDEVARAEQRLRVEQLETRCVDEFGMDVATLVGDYGPDQPVPPSADATRDRGAGADPDVGATAYDRAAQQARARAAERALAQLGRVNPLALEEYAAFEERQAFLSGQLEDLKASRRDLLAIVREVDERVEQVFADAFADTAREFAQVFPALFPGGEGRLVLTEPADLLTSGIEVEARLPGKKIKRLSLLSGGERSLTAIALLVAIFRARPSPFYVLDEIEAALDDRNLDRLLDLLDGLRERSQLIVVTHQQRTMEIADALYGVTMRGDGISTVISQRLRDRESA